MRNRNLLGILVLLPATLMSSSVYAGKSKNTVDQPLPSGAKVAVVQYAVDALNVNKHTVKMDAIEVDVSMDQELELLERSLSESGLFAEVLPYAGFAANEAYQTGGMELFTGTRKKSAAVNACHKKLFCPSTPAEMRVFADGDDLVVTTEQAAAAAAATGADLVLYVWGDYKLKVGFQKTALYRGNFALYDAQGARQSWIHTEGEQDAGMFPAGSEAVQSWVLASERAFAAYAQEVGR